MDDFSILSLSQIKFWLLLTLSIPSVLCSILILIHLYQKRNNLSIHHHLTLLLTTISFLQITTQIFLAMGIYRTGKLISTTRAFCTWWSWWDISLNGISRFIMAWGSIERHFLIFNSSLMATKTKRWICHILPTLITATYPLFFYTFAVILHTCEIPLSYTLLCQTPCFIFERSDLFRYDIIGSILLPILMISIANILLVFRVVYQKRRHHAAWRRQRKLTIQLFGIAFIYIVFCFPTALNGLFIAFTSSSFAAQLQKNYFVILVYMVPIVLPFILLAALPELTKKIFRRKQQRNIRPA